MTTSIDLTEQDISERFLTILVIFHLSINKPGALSPAGC